MMTSLIISCVAGVVLGQRFKVLALLPAFGFAVILAIGAGIAQGDQPWSIVLLVVAVIVALQIGYLIGTAARSLLGAGRTSREYRGSVPAAAVVRRPAHLA